MSQICIKIKTNSKIIINNIMAIQIIILLIYFQMRKICKINNKIILIYNNNLI